MAPAKDGPHHHFHGYSRLQFFHLAQRVFVAMYRNFADFVSWDL